MNRNPSSFSFVCREEWMKMLIIAPLPNWDWTERHQPSLNMVNRRFSLDIPFSQCCLEVERAKHKTFACLCLLFWLFAFILQKAGQGTDSCHSRQYLHKNMSRTMQPSEIKDIERIYLAIFRRSVWKGQMGMKIFCVCMRSLFAITSIEMISIWC